MYIDEVHHGGMRPLVGSLLGTAAVPLRLSEASPRPVGSASVQDVVKGGGVRALTAHS